MENFTTGGTVAIIAPVAGIGCFLNKTFFCFFEAECYQINTLIVWGAPGLYLENFI